MSWIVENKEWLFGGIAVAVPIAIIGWLITSKSEKQVQKGGKGSTNIQARGSINFGNMEKNGDE